MGFLDNLDLRELSRSLKLINRAGKTAGVLRGLQSALTLLTLAFAVYKAVMLIKNNSSFSKKISG